MKTFQLMRFAGANKLQYRSLSTKFQNTKKQTPYIKTNKAYSYHSSTFFNKSNKPNFDYSKLVDYTKMTLQDNGHWFYFIGILGMLAAFFYVAAESESKSKDSNSFEQEINEEIRRIFLAIINDDAQKFVEQFILVAKKLEANGNPKLIQAICLLEAEKFEEAMNLFDTIFIQELKRETHYNLVKGIFYYVNHRLLPALDCFEKVIASEMNELVSLTAMAYFYKSEILYQLILVRGVLGDKIKILEEKIFERNNVELLEEARQTLKRAKELDAELINQKKSYQNIKHTLQEYVRSYEHLQKLGNNYDPKKRVTIKIWNKSENASASKGHVSIETNEQYLSFYPIMEENNSYIESITKKYKGKNYSLFEDIEAHNGKLPDRRISIYGLDVDKINEFIATFSLNNEISWALKASTFFTGRGEHNCTSVAYEALTLGGINKFANRYIEDVWANVYRWVTYGAIGGLLSVGLLGLGIGFYAGISGQAVETFSSLQKYTIPTEIKLLVNFAKWIEQNVYGYTEHVVDALANGYSGAVVGGAAGGIVGGTVTGITSLSFYSIIAALLAEPASMSNLAEAAQVAEIQQVQNQLKPK